MNNDEPSIKLQGTLDKNVEVYLYLRNSKGLTLEEIKYLENATLWAGQAESVKLLSAPKGQHEV